MRQIDCAWVVTLAFGLVLLAFGSVLIIALIGASHLPEAEAICEGMDKDLEGYEGTVKLEEVRCKPRPEGIVVVHPGVRSKEKRQGLSAR
jgi:hypothetical protein